jgi:hypothetical protein
MAIAEMQPMKFGRVQPKRGASNEMDTFRGGSYHDDDSMGRNRKLRF